MRRVVLILALLVASAGSGCSYVTGEQMIEVDSVEYETGANSLGELVLRIRVDATVENTTAEVAVREVGGETVDSATIGSVLDSDAGSKTVEEELTLSEGPILDSRAYTIVVTDSVGDEVYYSEEVRFEGANVSATDGSVTTDEVYDSEDKRVEQFSVTVENDGDLPVIVDDVRVVTAKESNTRIIDETVPPGTSTTISEGAFVDTDGPSDTVELVVVSGGEEVATETVNVSD